MSDKIRLLIGAGQNKIYHMEKFSEVLQKHNIDCKLVIDVEVCNGFPSKEISQWLNPYSKFNELVKQYKPDAVFVDRQIHFGLAAIKKSLPLFVKLRGDYWSELEWAKSTIHSSLKSHFVLCLRNRIAEKSFSGATMILPFSNYLSGVVKSRYPNKQIMTLYDGLDLPQWNKTDTKNLRHPCVGLLQNASVWGKTKEMLMLTSVLEAMPEVTFYWAGDGVYREHILSVLGKYDNFKWLGSLQYPDKVKEYLSEIDVYALITGYDTFGMTTLEAEMVKTPVIVTNVGGTSEAMIENKTGFLVKHGNHKDVIEKINMLLNDQKLRKEFGERGHVFVKENFSWENIAKRFVPILRNVLDQ